MLVLAVFFMSWIVIVNEVDGGGGGGGGRMPHLRVATRASLYGNDSLARAIICAPQFTQRRQWDTRRQYGAE